MTLQTIADRLGVSRSTVSNAWNRPDHLSEALRRRIFEITEEIGYSGPDPVARKLRTGRHLALGLLFTDSLSYAIRDPAAVRFLEGVTVACEAAEVSLLLIPAVDDGQGVLSTVAQAAVDGLIVYSMPEKDPHVQVAIRRRLPLVVVDEPEEVDGADWVGLDEYGNFRRLGDHLVEFGHREVGIVCSRLAPDGYNGPVSPSRLEHGTFTVQVRRIAGLTAALADVGVSPVGVPVEERSDNDRSAGVDAGHALLERYRGLTSIVCTTDVLALGVLQAARERGLRVPEDLSVSGHDGIPEAAEAGLTTVHQPLVDKGHAAGRLLLTFGERKRPRRQTLPAQLRVRRSTGPAAQ